MLFGIAVLSVVGGAPNVYAADVLSGPSVRGGDPVAGVPALIDFSGYVDPRDFPTSLDIHVNPAPLACGADPEDNRGRAERELFYQGDPSGPFTGPIDWTPAHAGPVTLCAWLSETYPRKVLSAAAVPLNVRAPRAVMQLSMSRQRFDHAELITAEMTVSSEAGSWYQVEVNRSSLPCGPTVFSNQESALIGSGPITGGPTALTLSDYLYEDGGFHLCGYLGESIFDIHPVVVEGPSFWAGQGPSCRISGAPRRSTGRVTVRCKNVGGTVTIAGLRGPRRYVREVALRNGRASVRARAIGLRRGRRLKVRVSQSGVRLATRTLRGR